MLATIQCRIFYLLVCCIKTKIIILPVDLYGCESWWLTLKEEHTLRVSDNSMLRIFGPKRDEVTGSWRKLHNEELRSFYSPQSIIRTIKLRRMIW
jgi:hypothetical protein